MMARETEGGAWGTLSRKREYQKLVERHPTAPPRGYRPRRSFRVPSLNFSRPQCQSPAGDPGCPGVPPAERGQTPARAPLSNGAEGRTAEGRRGKRVGAAKRDPRPGAAARARGPRAPTRRRGAGAWRRFSPPARRRRRHRRSPPPGSLEAPRLPEREVEPSPRRPRRRESSAAAGAAGAGRAARRAPRGESGPLPGPPGVVRRAGASVRLAGPRNPARLLRAAQPATPGRLVPRGRRRSARPPAVRRPRGCGGWGWGAAGAGGGGGSARRRGLGPGRLGPAEGAAASGGRARTRSWPPGRVGGRCVPAVTLALPPFLVAFDCLIAFSNTY